MEAVVSQVASQETEPSVAINLAAFAMFAQAKLFEAQRLTTLATFSGSGTATPEQVSDLRNVAAQESYQANAFLALACQRRLRTATARTSRVPRSTRCVKAKARRSLCRPSP